MAKIFHSILELALVAQTCSYNAVTTVTLLTCKVLPSSSQWTCWYCCTLNYLNGDSDEPV